MKLSTRKVAQLFSVSFLTGDEHDYPVGFLEAREKTKDIQNDTQSRGRDGDVRHLRPEAGGGARPRRPLPGVSRLLPGGHPAAHGRVKR